jgi:hypothetical protein
MAGSKRWRGAVRNTRRPLAGGSDAGTQRHPGLLMSPPDVHRAVRLTARASALLFSTAQVVAHVDRDAGWRAAPALYRAFVAAHALHFVAVARYAVLTGGRNLFPGGRGLRDVGGWPTMAALWAVFGLLVAAGRIDGSTAVGGRRGAGAARVTIGAMFTGTYLGQASRSPWHGVLAAVTASGTVAAAGTSRPSSRSRHRPPSSSGRPPCGRSVTRASTRGGGPAGAATRCERSSSASTSTDSTSAKSRPMHSRGPAPKGT